MLRGNFNMGCMYVYIILTAIRGLVDSLYVHRISFLVATHTIH